MRASASKTSAISTARTPKSTSTTTMFRSTGVSTSAPTKRVAGNMTKNAPISSTTPEQRLVRARPSEERPHEVLITEFSDRRVEYVRVQHELKVKELPGGEPNEDDAEQISGDGGNVSGHLECSAPPTQ